MSQRSRRLEDRIRELCTKVVASKDSDELHTILPELRGAIHEATERIRLQAATILTKRPVVPKERRKPPGY
jgi:hypothetical protein